MDVGSVLFHILAVLLAAKAAAEISERVGVPAVVGEILAGVLIGPSALGLVEHDEVLRILGELGVILLLLEVGLQMDLAELGAVGRASVAVGLVGVAAPFGLGVAVAAAFGQDANTSIFVGAALTATSVGITARVFGDLRALASVEARTVLGAAVADDVLGLVILTVVVRIVNGGSVTVGSVSGIVAAALAFLVLTTAAGIRLAPSFFRWVHRQSRSSGTLVAVAFAFALTFAQLADVVKLAPIVGAFVAGVCLARSAQADRIRRELAPVGHLFVPVFFLQIGIDTDVGQFVNLDVLAIAGALLAVAIVGKLVAALGLGRSPGDRLVVGLGMLPRGEVGLIFAGIGLREGVLGEDLYAALLLVVLATTLASPPLLRARLRALQTRHTSKSATSVAPKGGWLVVREGVVDVVAEPPDHAALHVALQAARHATVARPGPALLDWFGGLTPRSVRWDGAATAELFDVLRVGNARSWRLLEMTGLLERALPELAEAFDRRRRDSFELDPGQAFRWELVEGLHEVVANDSRAALAHGELAHPEWVLLAALVADAAGDEGVVPTARRLVKRLDLGAAAEQEIALLVGETSLLRAAAARPDGVTEAPVLQVAIHIGTPERARALYLLTLAAGELPAWQRARLDELHDLVQEVLRDPELTGRHARNLVDGRRAAAATLASDRAVTERIAAAPVGFVLSQDAPALARQAALLEPLPSPGATRVAVTRWPSDGTWWVDVVARDRRGLLAAVTGGLASAGLNVVEASAATWGDGGVVETFRVAASGPPDPTRLTAAIDASLDAMQAVPGVPDAVVEFDDAGSPWYTLCSIRAGDRPGLLNALALAFAVSGVNVHSARVTTQERRAEDLFELSDRRGRKLDERTKQLVREAIATGVRVRPRRFARPRKFVLDRPAGRSTAALAVAKNW